MNSRQSSNGSASTRSMQRPDSRASTTSAVSQNDHQQEMRHDRAAFVNAGPEAALMQYHAGLEPQAMQYLPQDGQHQYSQNTQYPVHLQQHSSFLQDMPYEHNMRMASAPPSAIPDVHDDKRRKGTAVTATNDKELREMLERNKERPLNEVAQEVIQKERTPMAEKTKQLFAMIWLRLVCKPAKTSVPRNRVYSQYASRCATERVIPLNPASFGKLVRVIFPGIQTRRLGVRGESKYHYVDLALEDDSGQNATGWSSNAVDEPRSRRGTSASAQQIDFNNIPRLQADTAAFPQPDSFDGIPQPQPATPRGPPSSARTFAWPDSRGMQPGSTDAISYSQTLRFPSRDQPVFTENEPVTLPPIQPYVPPRTDPDTVEALCALYRTHCTSLIDSIRFCKEKSFFKLYTSFHGTLTVPVQKLFTNPSIAPWIEQCDMIMYRTMVRFVSRLTLQAAPAVVINVLSTISANLHHHVAKAFIHQPKHVQDAKLRPAAIFAALLYRLIRVNQSAHAAANLLTIDENRERMWFEWLTKVNPKRVMEAELPADCPYEEVYKILTVEMRALLEPLPLSDDPYSFNAYNISENGEFASYLQPHMMSRPTTAGDSASGLSTETILERWSAFIYSLPSRFPSADARTLLHCISAIGTAALRDITIMAGQSYGHWWVLKIFVDEMALWLAEMGGFLEGDQPVNALPAFTNGDSFYQSPTPGNLDGQTDHGADGDSGHISHASSMAPTDIAPSQLNGNTNGNTFAFQAVKAYQGDVMDTSALHKQSSFIFQDPNGDQAKFRAHETDIDDSGIVMDDDLSKYTQADSRQNTAHIGMMA